MASTTALPQTRAPVQRTVTVDSVSTSSNTSSVASPADSPRGSPSATSLSSLSSVDEEITKGQAGTLIDTYGNEFKIPDYTIKQLRDAIPAHCFERSAATGYAYIARDLALLATTFALFYNFNTPEYVPSTPVRFVLWNVYAIMQGLFGTGIWVIAHECGHQAFSPSKTVNDITGWVLHSALLVPYFSWKISHGKHHKATGNMERDMVHIPKTRNEYAARIGHYAHELSELMEETPIATATHMVVRQALGWPMYLFTNVTGHNNHEKQPEGKGQGKKNGYFGGVSHFFPSSPLYERKDERLILLSDLGLAITVTALYFLAQKVGWANVGLWYFAPYMWVNHWLVGITYLQHTDPTLPHYEASSWTFARGAAATIDREFGFVGRHLLHGIIETHVLHHYISTIPFYHADEATEAIKPVMGQHYRSDTKGGPIGFLKALYTASRWCQWVEPSEGAQGEGKGVLFYRNRNGLGTKPVKMTTPGEKNRPAMTIGADSDNE